MRKKMLAGAWGLVSFTFLVVVSCAHARLGESVAESIARYGPPVNEPSVIMLPLLKSIEELRFHHFGWRIRAGLLDDRTVVISFMKKGSPGPDTLLQDDEIKAILQAESQGYTWIRVENGDTITPSRKFQKIIGSSDRVWKNGKGAVAWVSANRALTIISEQGLQLDVDSQRKREKKRKESLQHF